MAKATKAVQIIGRVEFKSDPRKVVYLNRASDGVKQYETSLFDGKATSCSCPSRKPCKHMKHSEQVEAERVAKAVVETPEQKEAREWAEYRREVAKKLSAQYMTTEIVEQVAELLVAPKVVKTVSPEIVPPIAMELPAELRGYRKTAISADLSTKGNLNGAQQSAGVLMALPSRRKAKAS